MNKKLRQSIFITACLMTISCSFFLLQGASAMNEVREELQPRGNPKSYFSYNLIYNQDSDISSSREIRFYADPNTFEYLSSNMSSVYVVNQSEFAEALANNIDPSKFMANKNWTKINKIAPIQLTAALLIQDWKLENQSFFDREGKTHYFVSFYVIIVNEAEVNTQFALKFQSPNVVVEYFSKFTNTLIYILFFIVGSILIKKSRIEAKRDEKHLANVLRNYGIGLIFGGFGTVDWAIEHYINELDALYSWSNLLEFKEMPSIFAANLMSFITFIALGLSISFMSYTIERDIQQKKSPYLTNFLLVMEVVILVFAAVIKSFIALKIGFEIAVYVWVFSLVLAMLNLGITYINVIRVSTGLIRIKSLIFLVSLFVAFSMVALRSYIRPEFIPNILTIIGILGIFKGLTMDLVPGTKEN